MFNSEYFDQRVNRNGTNCYKWDKRYDLFGRKDIIPLWVADLDFRSPPAVIECLQKRAAQGVYGYTFPSDSYYNSIMKWQKRRHSWEFKKEEIINIPGVVPGISTAIQSYTQPGEKILILTPVYDPFFTSIEINNRIIVKSDLKLVKNHYEIDFDDLAAKIRDVKILLFCSPHNPVGRVWERAELEQVAEICLENEVLIVSDEIHSDLVYDGYQHIPIAKLSKQVNETCITLNAPSKTFNIAGLSAAYAIISNEDLRIKFQKTIDMNRLSHGNIFGMLALETAYEKGEIWLENLLHYLAGNHDYLTEFFSKEVPEIKPVTIEGTYLAWLNCKSLNLDQESLIDFFINKAKVGLTSGEQYGAAGRGFMRLNFGCPRQILAEALENIKAAVRN
jgi:cysteine-S-conjugate beta-lyase